MVEARSDLFKKASSSMAAAVESARSTLWKTVLGVESLVDGQELGGEANLMPTLPSPRLASPLLSSPLPFTTYLLRC